MSDFRAYFAGRGGGRSGDCANPMCSRERERGRERGGGGREGGDREVIGQSL